MLWQNNGLLILSAKEKLRVMPPLNISKEEIETVQVEMFADAIEASANDRTPRVPINVTYLQEADEIVKFMEKRKKTDAAGE